MTDVDEKLKELARDKLPLVAQDYRTHFDGSTRTLEHINNLRRWEITVLSAYLIALITKFQAVLHYNKVVLLIIIVFAILEAIMQANRGRSGYLAKQAEDKLQATTQEEFYTNIVNWKFGNTRGDLISRTQRLKHIYWSIRNPSYWLWHFGLAVIIGVIGATGEIKP